MTQLTADGSSDHTAAAAHLKRCKIIEYSKKNDQEEDHENRTVQTRTKRRLTQIVFRWFYKAFKTLQFCSVSLFCLLPAHQLQTDLKCSFQTTKPVYQYKTSSLQTVIIRIKVCCAESHSLCCICLQNLHLRYETPERRSGWLQIERMEKVGGQK